MQMATTDPLTPVPCAEIEDEIEGLNEKLLEQLSFLKVSTPKNDGKTSDLSNPLVDLQRSISSEVFGHYRYDCSFYTQRNTINASTPASYLPPIGVFWDIENCQVPKGKSAMVVVQAIRDKFFTGYREAEFIVVCDVQKEVKQVVQDLNDAQVNLIHVASTCKNAADEKLKQSIRRFADIHGNSAAIILISGDVNFAADLSDLRHRKKIHVILLHKENTSTALILCANEHYNFTELVEPLSARPTTKVSETYDLLVYNLPRDKDVIAIKRRLKHLSSNCGGRVMGVESNVGTVRFLTQDSAVRAQKRMDGEFVLGSQITVKFQEGKVDNNGETLGKEEIGSCEYSTSESEVGSNTKQMYSASASVRGARSLPATPHYYSSSPVIGAYPGWNGLHCPVTAGAPPGIIQPPAAYMGRAFPSNGDAGFNRSYSDLPRVYSSSVWQMSSGQQCARLWDEQYKAGKTKLLGKRIQVPQARDNDAATGIRSRTPDGFRRIRESPSTFPHLPPLDWNTPRPAPFSNSSLPTGYTPGNGYTPGPTSFKRRSSSPMYELGHWNGQPSNQQSGRPRCSRTPSPFDQSNVSRTTAQQTDRISPYQHSDAENEEVENFFNPINNRNSSTISNGTYTPIELQVTNLDQSIEPKEMKQILSSVFTEHVAILSISLFMQSDGSYAASVKVPSLSDAQYAISQLHRRKVGYKRILISYAHAGGPNPQLVRSQIVMLLQDVPEHRLPLFKFRQMYESRFMSSISVSEMHKMRDVCTITEEADGRMVTLNPDHRNTPSPCASIVTQNGLVELPYCTIHARKPWSGKGWAEQEVATLPNIKVPLKVFSTRLHRLLTSHEGSLPLRSFPSCYEAEFNEKLNVDETGVPLEHLVLCVPSVELKQGAGSVKRVVWASKGAHNTECEEAKRVSPPLANQLALFSRELVDLLKTAPHCQILFNRFIPAYHHHFGRQCRVADYGFTKLIDLLEALAHTVQVMGEGNSRVVTLSHRAQIRRFTSDLLRVLKAQASKQVSLAEFPSVYAKVIGKPWDIADYGVCEMDDILGEVSEGTIVVKSVNETNDKIIAIPKRKQTPEEIERTKKFATEVVELLRHAPRCKMLFNKFVPSYHHHFSHQCRVSDYGFTKLIELFEAIPDVVKIEDTNGGERRIALTEKEALQVIAEQIAMLSARSKGGLDIANVGQAFLCQFGYALRPEVYGCSSMLKLLEKLDGIEAGFEVIETPAGTRVVAVSDNKKPTTQELTLRCRRVLMDHPWYRLPVAEFQHLYSRYYRGPCNFEELENSSKEVVQFTTINGESFVELAPLQGFACDLYRVLTRYGGSMNASQFENAYQTIIGQPLRVSQFGYSSLTALLQALPCTVTLKESRQKEIIQLNKKLAISLPSTSSPRSRSNDSGSESFESETSSRSSILAETSNPPANSTKRPGQTTETQAIWKRKYGEPKSWKKNNDSQLEAPNEWPALEEQQTPQENTPTDVMRIPFPPAPVSPDLLQSPVGAEEKKTGVWETPPRVVHSTQDKAIVVHLPPLTSFLHWEEGSSDESPSYVISPMMHNLSVTGKSSVSRNFASSSFEWTSVEAPHPSELPLPSLSLTPVKKSPVEVQVAIDDPEVASAPGHDEVDSVGRSSVTPNKRKRRLAAQFDQPIDATANANL
ncbi:meiosis regulator and mRNA stability factor 1 isoform X2 [Orussus abietinus]|uniref:meiosis regulator and mRNA stability factor 1 isoform X2 n=1 Tax=Orussus abietinus TaxID=222816 RepID=UPI00062574B3|nr:meiosis regulator and mRNA stability factor 1 isoform X2 [Orussus abietinus]